MGKPTKKSDQDKDWAEKKKFPYLVGSKKVGKPFLIICEGVVTEPIYFEAIAGPNVQVTTKGYGSSKTALVQRAEKHCIDESVDPAKVSVWVVFDFDVKYDQVAKQKEDYNRAIDLAKSKGFQVAYSNDCFELWLVLHLKDVTAGQHRTDYYQSLRDYFGSNYEKLGKNRNEWLGAVSRFKSDPKTDSALAVKRAFRLHQDQKHLPYADQNPCTTIYELANKLDPISFPL